MSNRKNMNWDKKRNRYSYEMRRGKSAFRALLPALIFGAGLCAMPGNARAQIFETNAGNLTIGEYTTSGAPVGTGTLVSDLPDYPFGIAVSGADIFVVEGDSNFDTGFIQEYTTSGSIVSGSLISRLNQPAGIAVSGSYIFVTSYNSNDTSGMIGEYTTSGSTVNASLVTGLNNPALLAVSGSNIFVANYGNGTIGEYTTSGSTVNALLISGLHGPEGIAVSGSDIFVTNKANNTIGEYTTSGGTVNASLVSNSTPGATLDYPTGIAVSGSDIFVANADDGAWIGEYTTSGSAVNYKLVPGLDFPEGIAVATPGIPEPSTCALAAISAGLLLVRRRRRRNPRCRLHRSRGS